MFIRDDAGNYLNTDLFCEMSVRFDKNANLFIVYGWYKGEDAGKVELKGFETREKSQDWLDEVIDKYQPRFD